MSLDCYLQRQFDLSDVNGFIDITAEGERVPINVSKVTNIIEQVGEWHKAYHIHDWIIKHIEKSGTRPGSKYVDVNVWWLNIYDLMPLLNKCKEVVDKVEISIALPECGHLIQNPEVVKKILPIPEEQLGISGREYDYWYLRDCRDTIKFIKSALSYETILNDKGFFPDYYYVIS